MHIRKISNYTDFLSLKKDWNKLLKKSGQDSIFLRHEWFDCWWRSHAETYEDAQNLSILLIEDKGKCIGIIPLKTSRVKYRGLKVKKLGFLESGLSPCVDVILTSEKEESLREALHFLKKQRAWDILILNKLSIKSENYKLLEKILKEENIMFGIKSSLNNPIIPTVEHWPDFLSKRSTKFRKSLRYKLNKAKKLSSFQIERISEPNDIKNKLSLILEISKKSWKAKFKQSIADITEYRDFFEYFTDEAGKMGWINVWLLKNSSDYIAYEYHLMYDGIVYPIGADFDESFSQLSPGSILEYHIIKALFEDPEVKEYNTCAHSYKYLRNWTDIIEPHADIEVFNSRVLGGVLYLTEYKVVPYLRQVPLFQYAKDYLIKKNIWARNDDRVT